MFDGKDNIADGMKFVFKQILGSTIVICVMTKVTPNINYRKNSTKPKSYANEGSSVYNSIPVRTFAKK